MLGFSVKLANDFCDDADKSNKMLLEENVMILARCVVNTKFVSNFASRR